MQEQWLEPNRPEKKERRAAWFRRYYAKNKESILPRNRKNARIQRERIKARKAAQKQNPQ